MTERLADIAPTTVREQFRSACVAASVRYRLPMRASMNLTKFDARRFLRENWQKAPLLIRDAWDAWRNPLEPDELAGLACEPGIEARLITQAGGRWQVEHGPLSEDRFAELGEDPWTLLVQAVDHHVPEVAALLAPFRFVPNWRVDDVMVSYAVDGGGVGPHFDQYDVFLVQGLGRRRWQLGARCDASTRLMPHDDLRLLAEFEPIEEWVLGPGDILYVPPGVAHNGIAEGDECMTYSIGFRAPARRELVEGWAEHVADLLDDDDRYADPALALQGNPGEISTEALVRLHRMVSEALADRAAFARWFGAFSTARKYLELDWRLEDPAEPDEIRSFVRRGAPLLRNPASRFSFVRRENGALWLFVDGDTFDCEGPAADFAEKLCADTQIGIDANLLQAGDVLTLIVDLVNQGAVAFESAVWPRASTAR